MIFIILFKLLIFLLPLLCLKATNIIKIIFYYEKLQVIASLTIAYFFFFQRAKLEINIKHLYYDFYLSLSRATMFRNQSGHPTQTRSFNTKTASKAHRWRMGRQRFSAEVTIGAIG